LLPAQLEMSAAEPAPAGNSSRAGADGSLGVVFAGFDSEHFATRQRARARLSQLLADKQQGAAIAEAAHRILLDPATSVELRTQLQAVLEQLPDSAPPAPPSDLMPADIAATIALLGADTDQARLAAETRLRWYVAESKLACRMLGPLKAALADPLTTRNAQPVVKALLEKARRRWLVDDALDELLPPVLEPQIRQWIALVGEPTGESVADRFRQEAARCELLDLLAREAYRANITALIVAAKDAATDPEGAVRLQELFDWTRPAMVAECWSGGTHKTIQHLLIGVPQVPEGSNRATQFDRIDDHTAHCVTGNSLQPGDYPVGVALPHPAGQEVLFHLINLPTPRRRMVYELTAERPQEERFAELSRRTVTAILAGKRHLSEIEIGMLTQLDPEVVSKFIGDYFAVVPDQTLPHAAFRPTGQVTEHDAICYVLARIGTRSAHPALEREAQARRATDGNAIPVARLASLAIARRDPWPAVDDWLADLAAKEVEFVMPKGQKADLGATAAALLAWRHGVPDDWFDLDPLDDGVLESVGVTPYRFTQPEGRAALLRWWQRQRSESPAAPAS
jgi:hypothetical protein